MEIVNVVLPAAWACALLKDEWAKLERKDPAEAGRARVWLHNSGLTVLSCGSHPFIARYDGVLTQCLEYECAPRQVR